MKSLEQPLLVPIRAPGDDPLYRVVQPWHYHWELPGRPPQRLTVPRDFEVDGASVPRFLWTLTGITPDGLHRAAALAHDSLYRYAGHLPAGAHQIHLTDGWADSGHLWTREEADRLFARILRECGVGRTRRRLMYLGVRLGGWRSWRR
jgi:hypothetical protein